MSESTSGSSNLFEGDNDLFRKAIEDSVVSTSDGINHTTVNETNAIPSENIYSTNIVSNLNTSKTDRYLVDYPLSDGDSENEQDIVRVHGNSSIETSKLSTNAVIIKSESLVNESKSYKDKKKRSNKNKKLDKTTSRTKKNYGEVIRSIEGPDGRINIFNACSVLEDTLESPPPLSFRYEEDDISVPTTHSSGTAIVGVNGNKIPIDKEDACAFSNISPMSINPGVSPQLNTDILQVARNRLSRFSESYGLESTFSEKWSDSTSTDSNDYDEYSEYESDDTLNNMIGNCEVKDRDSLIEEDLCTSELIDLSVKQSLCKSFGSVMHVLDTTVVIRSLGSSPVLDRGSVLFSDEGKALGKIEDTFGSVDNPFYTMRFSSKKIIKELCIVSGQNVYYAPNTTYTIYVDPEILRNTERGSDASWVNNEEPPNDCVDYSDDEKERSSKSVRSGKKRAVVKREDTKSECDSKEVHRNFVDQMNKKNAELSAKRAKEDETNMWTYKPIKQESCFDPIVYPLRSPGSLFNMAHSSPSPPCFSPIATSNSHLLYGRSLPPQTFWRPSHSMQFSRAPTPQTSSKMFNNPMLPPPQASPDLFSSPMLPPPPPTASHMVPSQIPSPVVTKLPTVSWSNQIALPTLHYSNPHASRFSSELRGEPEFCTPDRRTPYTPYSSQMPTTSRAFVQSFSNHFHTHQVYGHSAGNYLPVTGNVPSNVPAVTAALPATPYGSYRPVFRPPNSYNPYVDQNGGYYH